MTKHLLRFTILAVLMLSAACDTTVEPSAVDDSAQVGLVSQDGESGETELDCTIGLSDDNGFLAAERNPGVQVVQDSAGGELSLWMDPGNSADQCREWYLAQDPWEDPELALDKLSDGDYRILHYGTVHPLYGADFRVELWVHPPETGAWEKADEVVIWIGAGAATPIFAEMTITCPDLSVWPGDEASANILRTGGEVPVTYEKEDGPDWITVDDDGEVTASPGSSVSPGTYYYDASGTDSATEPETATCAGAVEVLGRTMTITTPNLFVEVGSSVSGDLEQSGGTAPVSYELVSDEDWISLSGATVTASPDESVLPGGYTYVINGTDSSTPALTASATGIVYVTDDEEADRNDARRTSRSGKRQPRSLPGS